MDILEFVEEFTTKHKKLIIKVANKYRIPNRYDPDDLVNYVSERIIDILTKRQNDPKKEKIDNPEKYFKSCLDFYCIEYQRMNGYIFGLPKRPRKNCEEDEKWARSRGFKYMDDMTVDEYNSLYEEKPVVYEEQSSHVWDTITGLFNSRQAQILDCRYRRDMKWKEIAEHLGIPQSTSWFEHKHIKEQLFEKLDNMPGPIADNIKAIIRNDSNVLGELSDT